MDIIGAIIAGTIFLCLLVGGIYVFGSNPSLAVGAVGGITGLIFLGRGMTILFLSHNNGEWDL